MCRLWHGLLLGEANREESQLALKMFLMLQEEEVRGDGCYMEESGR